MNLQGPRNRIFTQAKSAGDPNYPKGILECRVQKEGPLGAAEGPIRQALHFQFGSLRIDPYGKCCIFTMGPCNKSFQVSFCSSRKKKGRQRGEE
jgi:hypothetical protein